MMATHEDNSKGQNIFWKYILIAILGLIVGLITAPYVRPLLGF